MNSHFFNRDKIQDWKNIMSIIWTWDGYCTFSAHQLQFYGTGEILVIVIDSITCLTQAREGHSAREIRKSNLGTIHIKWLSYECEGMTMRILVKGNKVDLQKGLFHQLEQMSWRQVAACPNHLGLQEEREDIRSSIQTYDFLTGNWGRKCNWWTWIIFCYSLFNPWPVL